MNAVELNVRDYRLVLDIINRSDRAGGRFEKFGTWIFCACGR